MYSSVLKNNPLRLFDVTLRDGLQSISKIYNVTEKLQMIENIIVHRRPDAIEIGSIVSSSLVPQMTNSLDLFKELSSSHLPIHKPTDIYMLTPTLKSVEIARKHNVQNFSFVTSVSNVFQNKNINKTIAETKNELKHMIDNVTTINDDTKIKLYISCIDTCPIIGKIVHIDIITEIMYYYDTYEKINEICLSDTHGSLLFRDFKYIIDELTIRNVDFERFSLHLHNQYDRQQIKHILTYAMKIGISKFDVSDVSHIGDCITTVDKQPTDKQPTGNLDYEQIYECL